MSLLEFGANLLATLIGVVLGIPVALWLDRRSRRSGEQAEQTARKARREQALHVVRVSLEESLPELNALEESLAHSTIPVDHNLETARWDAVRAIVTENHDDPQHVAALSRHFARIEQVSRILTLLQEQTFGMPSALGSARQVRPLLLNSVIIAVRRAKASGTRLHNQLQETDRE